MKGFKKQLVCVTLALSMALAPASAALADSRTASVSAVENGIEKVNGKIYIYKNGKLVKNQIAYKYGSNYYNINKKGVATKLKGAMKDAAKIIANTPAIKKAKSKSAKLKQCLLYCAGLKAVTVADLKTEAKYAKYGFATQTGDCMTQACAMAYLARVLGYDFEVQLGYLYFEKATSEEDKYAEHAWCTWVNKKGQTRVFDPNSRREKYDLIKQTYGEKYAERLGWNLVYGGNRKYTQVYCDTDKNILK